MFSHEISENFKKTNFEENLRTTASKEREIACETAYYVSPKTCSQKVQIFRLATKKSKTYLGFCQTLVMELLYKKQLTNFAKRYLPKHSSICVLIKGCSENFQQIYRKTPKPNVIKLLCIGILL